MKLLSILLAILIAAAPIAAAEPPLSANSPFRDVPTTHWAYDAVQSLAQLGFFTGFPNGTFQGRRPLTRYEFGVAVQRLLAEMKHHMAASPGLYQGGLSIGDVTALQKLAQEFSPELTMLGLDLEKVKQELFQTRDRVTWVVMGPRSIPVEDFADLPYDTDSAEVRARYPTAAAKGARRARDDWRLSRTVLLSWQDFNALQISKRLGLPCRYVPGSEEPGPQLAYVCAHNREVLRLIEQHGLPVKSSRLPWMGSILNPNAAFEPAGKRPTSLSASRSEASSPDGDVLLRLNADALSRSLRVTLPSGEALVALTGFEPEARLEVAWGPSEARLLFLRWNDKLRVIDLNTGLTLHRVP